MTIPSAHADVAIELRDVVKTYVTGGKSINALDGVSFSVPRGAIHGIVGQSGAGKSTLVRCLTALEKPTSGEVLVDGRNLSRLGSGELRAARRNIGMVFQHANLLDARTAEANVAYPLKLAGVKGPGATQRVYELLSLVGLEGRGHHYPSELSGGQKQRVGIARALADEPAVLLCDEPTSALDSETTRQVLSLIRDVRDRLGVTVVIITHEMSVVRSVCDSVTLLEAGKVSEHGPLEQVLANPGSRLSRELVPPPAVGEGIGPVVDISFTSHPGEPTGSRMMALIASLGADVAAGVFETVGQAQIGRLALTCSTRTPQELVAELSQHGVSAEVRA
ncbi:MAG: methionine ABC transporter ATP-binding protein [Buchananella hordeovulneris]|nr:methionine ABC transporter ATP-binding protein [Buchananella hordeovulneris]